MKVGNKTHAIALSIVGLSAVAALVFQLKARMAMPGGSHAPAKEAAPLVASAIPSSLPHMIYGDPFTHPKLPRVLPPSKKTSAEPVADHSATRSGPPILSGNLDVAPLIPNVHGKVDDTQKSAEPAVKAPVISLQAIVSAPDPVAFISIDGKDPQQFGVGDSVAAGVTITRIDEGEIQIGGAGGTRRLRVGGKLQL